ncbi:hypothetical protein Tco_0066469 [Tanacetum coccineum]
MNFYIRRMTLVFAKTLFLDEEPLLNGLLTLVASFRGELDVLAFKEVPEVIEADGKYFAMLRLYRLSVLIVLLVAKFGYTEILYLIKASVIYCSRSFSITLIKFCSSWTLYRREIQANGARRCTDWFNIHEVPNDPEDSLTSTMMLLAREITQGYSTPTNNQICSSSNTRNQAIVQADRGNIQSKNIRYDGIIARYSYNVQEETVEGSNVQKETENDSKYFMEQILLAKKDEAGVILFNEQNDFLLADVVQMEELEELSANICMMAIIQPTNIDSDEGSSYDFAFISEVQTPSTSNMNPLFTDDDHEQTYHEQPKIIKSIIGDDPNVKVNNGNVDHDKNVHDSYELEQLAIMRIKKLRSNN